MGKVMASALAGKEIVTIEGTVLGILEDLVFDLKTGAVIDITVKPDSQIDKSRFREEGRFIMVPFKAVSAIKDYIVVDEGKAVMR
jgi:sporulation protein YlmC with PRC-barrel domain